MRSVTSSYLTASHLSTRVSSIRAEYSDSLTTIQIGRQDIEQGSVTIDESAIPSSTFDIGSANISTMGISLRITDTNKWESITNGTIKLYYKIKLANSTYEEIKLGTFLIPQSGIKKTPYKVELKLISRMSLFDKSTEAVTTSGTPYQLLSWACEQCDVTFAMTQAQIEAMPNGLYSFAVIEDSSCETFRDVVMWVAHLLCGFAAMNSDGHLVIRSFKSSPVYTINRNVIESHTLGDTNLGIENVIMKSGNFLFNIDPTVKPEKTITLDENMLFKGNTVESMLREYITNIKNEIQTISYIPFTLTFNGDPCIELGDVLTLWDSGYVGLVTDISWNYNGMCTISGANFTSINSKSQSTSSRTTSGGGGGTTDVMKTSRYENIADIIIGTAEKELFSFNFSIGANLIPKVTATYVLEVLTAGVFTIKLEYDNITLMLKPKFTAPIGFYSGTISLALPPSQAEGNHMFIATIVSDVGSATIQEYNVQAYVEGMNLNTGSAEFNGRLALTDSFTPIVLTTDKLQLKTISETLGIDAKAQDNIGNFTDTFMGISLDGSNRLTLKTITESVSATTT